MNLEAAKISSDKALEFRHALESGRNDWTPEELSSFFLEPKKKAERVTVSEYSLGPIDPARAWLVAKVVAGVLGANVESGPVERNGKKLEGYIFTSLDGSSFKSQGVKIVEKIVEKIVHVQPQADRNAPKPGEVIFPEDPIPGKVNPQYVTPAWYKRMEAALKAGKHVAIAGPPGGGKSTAPEQYFIKRGQKFVTVNGDAGFRRRDMEGSVEVQQGSTFFRVAEFAAAAVNGWGCILNEVNAADPDALMYINGLLEVPFVVNIHGKAYPVHPDFRLVVTYNPGLIGTKAMPQAFKDRFFPIKLDFPPKSFILKLLIAKGMDSTAPYADRLLKYAQDCWTLHVKGNLRYQISPRRLFDVVFLMDSGAVENLEDAIKQAVIDSVDSAADAQMLTKLVTQPLNEIQAVSQFA